MYTLEHFIKIFLVGGFTIAVVSYLANYFDASLAGFLVGIPVGILLIFFIIDEDRIVEYTITHTISIIILAIISILFYYLYMVRGFGKNDTILITLIIWFISIIIVWTSNIQDRIKVSRS